MASFRRSSLSIALLVLPLLSPSLSHAVSFGAVDDFEDGTVQDWVVNLLGIGVHPAPPANVADGGPDGAGDNYLLLSSVGGNGAGSRLVALNLAQWAGNYFDGGVNAIDGWARNLGNTDVFLRVLLENPLGGPPTDVAISDSILLPAGGGWTQFLISLRADELTTLAGSLDALLPNVTAVRLLHSAAGGFPGETSAALLGLDDLRAGFIVVDPVPEPAALGLLLLGLAGLAVERRRRS